LIVAIPPKHAIAEIVKRLKGASSHYLNYDVRLEQQFAWQRGYGVLSIGERQRAIAEAYVENQKQHHGEQTTNAWLERAEEFDEGPPEIDLLYERSPQAIRETKIVYHLLGEPPL
jgi:putative transposase